MADPIVHEPRYPDIVVDDPADEDGSEFLLYSRTLEALALNDVEDIDEFTDEIDRDDVLVSDFREIISRWVTIG